MGAAGQIELQARLVVGLASTTFMLVSTHFACFQHYTRDDWWRWTPPASPPGW